MPVPDGSKWCPDCEAVKPLAEFARTKASASGYHSYCRPCHNARGNETKQRLYGGSREYHLRHRYGVGQAEFDELLAEQGASAPSVARPTPNTSITIIAPAGFAGYCASTATAALDSSGTTRCSSPKLLRT